jgi:hypothetical protein
VSSQTPAWFLCCCLFTGLSADIVQKHLTTHMMQGVCLSSRMCHDMLIATQTLVLYDPKAMATDLISVNLDVMTRSCRSNSCTDIGKRASISQAMFPDTFLDTASLRLRWSHGND